MPIEHTNEEIRLEIENAVVPNVQTEETSIEKNDESEIITVRKKIIKISSFTMEEVSYQQNESNFSQSKFSAFANESEKVWDVVQCSCSVKCGKLN